MRQDIDPKFNVKYDEGKHGDYLRENLKIDHLISQQQVELTELIIKFWPVFRPEGMCIPVRDYACHIDMNMNMNLINYTLLGF